MNQLIRAELPAGRTLASENKDSKKIPDLTDTRKVLAVGTVERLGKLSFGRNGRTLKR